MTVWASPPKEASVVLHPAQYGGLVLGAEVGRADLRQIEVTQRPHIGVGGDEHDVAQRGEACAIVSPSRRSRW